MSFQLTRGIDHSSRDTCTASKSQSRARDRALGNHDLKALRLKMAQEPYYIMRSLGPETRTLRLKTAQQPYITWFWHKDLGPYSLRDKEGPVGF